METQMIDNIIKKLSKTQISQLSRQFNRGEKEMINILSSNNLSKKNNFETKNKNSESIFNK